MNVFNLLQAQKEGGVEKVSQFQVRIRPARVCIYYMLLYSRTCTTRPVGVGEAGEASASSLFSHQSYNITTKLPIFYGFLLAMGGIKPSHPLWPPYYDFPSYGPDNLYNW